MLKKLASYLIIIGALMIFLGRDLLPFTDQMFTFHDKTQAGRVLEFSQNLASLKLPPRISSEFSYEMGYPVFNFYAPFAYWVASLITLLGAGVIVALKLTFLFAVITAFVSMYLLLRAFFGSMPSLSGAVVYASSPYVAIETFVRGNIAEAWFVALAPLGLYLLYKNHFTYSKKTLAATALVLSFIFTSHNIFAVIFLGFVLIAAVLLKSRRNLIAIGTGLLVSSYFLVPAVFESSLTYAVESIRQTNYSDHFLCLRQLWHSAWGFGGSVPGCESDGMSFMLGKLHLVFGGAGAALFLYRERNRASKIFRAGAAVLALSTIFTFLTLQYSKPVWDALSPFASIMQFPWRFLIFGVFGLAFFSAYLFEKLTVRYKDIIILLAILVTLVFSSRFFKGQNISVEEYSQLYMSQEFLHGELAYRIPEYLPRTADITFWRSLQEDDVKREEFVSNRVESILQKTEDRGFVRSYEAVRDGSALVPIHYFPVWRIALAGREISPTEFDELGRPVVTVRKGEMIEVSYRQTNLEMIANLMTVAGLVALGLYAFENKGVRI